MEETTYIRTSLSGAIASILGRTDHEGYRNVGQSMDVKSLYKLLGLTSSPMIYNYLSGKTQTIVAERAVILYETFGLLVDYWLTPEDLYIEASNTAVSKKLAREPFKEILEEIIVIEREEDCYEMRRGLRKLIARHY